MALCMKADGLRRALGRWPPLGGNRMNWSGRRYARVLLLDLGLELRGRPAAGVLSGPRVGPHTRHGAVGGLSSYGESWRSCCVMKVCLFWACRAGALPTRCCCAGWGSGCAIFPPDIVHTHDANAATVGAFCAAAQRHALDPQPPGFVSAAAWAALVEVPDCRCRCGRQPGNRRRLIKVGIPPHGSARSIPESILPVTALVRYARMGASSSRA